MKNMIIKVENTVEVAQDALTMGNKQTKNRSSELKGTILEL